jgi:Spy/CpxP family protein refolding chaperone
MKKCLIMVVLMLAATAVTSLSVYAQDMGPGRWWQRPSLAKELNLTEGERQALDDMFAQSRDRFIDLRGDIEKERNRLDDLLNKDKLNDKALAAQYKRVEDVRQKLAAERFKYILGVRKILGPDRFRRFTGMAEEMRKKRYDSGDQGYWGRQDQTPSGRSWNDRSYFNRPGSVKQRPEGSGK